MKPAENIRFGFLRREIPDPDAASGICAEYFGFCWSFAVPPFTNSSAGIDAAAGARSQTWRLADEPGLVAPSANPAA